MPFILKNTGATYQRAMNTIFHEHICKTVECYIDDIVVKSYDKDDHIEDLKRVFNIIWTNQWKINPTKSFPGMASGKYLGFVVTFKEFHLDPEKISEKPQITQRIIKTIDLHLEIHIKSLKTLPILNQIDEEGSFIHLV